MKLGLCFSTLKGGIKASTGDILGAMLVWINFTCGPLEGLWNHLWTLMHALLSFT